MGVKVWVGLHFRTRPYIAYNVVYTVQLFHTQRMRHASRCH